MGQDDHLFLPPSLPPSLHPSITPSLQSLIPPFFSPSIHPSLPPSLLPFLPPFILPSIHLYEVHLIVTIALQGGLSFSPTDKETEAQTGKQLAQLVGGCRLPKPPAHGVPSRLTQHPHAKHERVHGVRQPPGPASCPRWEHDFLRLSFLTFYLLNREANK